MIANGTFFIPASIQAKADADRCTRQIDGKPCGGKVAFDSFRTETSRLLRGQMSVYRYRCVACRSLAVLTGEVEKPKPYRHAIEGDVYSISEELNGTGFSVAIKLPLGQSFCEGDGLARIRIPAKACVVFDGEYLPDEYDNSEPGANDRKRMRELSGRLRVAREKNKSVSVRLECHTSIKTSRAVIEARFVTGGYGMWLTTIDDKRTFEIDGVADDGSLKLRRVDDVKGATDSALIARKIADEVGAVLGPPAVRVGTALRPGPLKPGVISGMFLGSGPRMESTYLFFNHNTSETAYNCYRIGSHEDIKVQWNGQDSTIQKVSELYALNLTTNETFKDVTLPNDIVLEMQGKRIFNFCEVPRKLAEPTPEFPPTQQSPLIVDGGYEVGSTLDAGIDALMKEPVLYGELFPIVFQPVPFGSVRSRRKLDIKEVSTTIMSNGEPVKVVLVDGQPNRNGDSIDPEEMKRAMDKYRAAGKLDVHIDLNSDAAEFALKISEQIKPFAEKMKSAVRNVVDTVASEIGKTPEQMLDAVEAYHTGLMNKNADEWTIRERVWLAKYQRAMIEAQDIRLASLIQSIQAAKSESGESPLVAASRAAEIGDAIENAQWKTFSIGAMPGGPPRKVDIPVEKVEGWDGKMEPIDAQITDAPVPVPLIVGGNPVPGTHIEIPLDFEDESDGGLLDYVCDAMTHVAEQMLNREMERLEAIIVGDGSVGPAHIHNAQVESMISEGAPVPPEEDGPFIVVAPSRSPE